LAQRLEAAQRRKSTQRQICRCSVDRRSAGQLGAAPEKKLTFHRKTKNDVSEQYRVSAQRRIDVANILTEVRRWNIT
jgi:hypothetical protein